MRANGNDGADNTVVVCQPFEDEFAEHAAGPLAVHAAWSWNNHLLIAMSQWCD